MCVCLHLDGWAKTKHERLYESGRMTYNDAIKMKGLEKLGCNRGEEGGGMGFRSRKVALGDRSHAKK